MDAESQPSKSVLDELKGPLAVVLVLVALLVAADLINSYAWLWVGLLGAVGIFLHARFASRALLVVGAFLTGSGVGILLEATLNFTGAYLSSVGAAVAMVEFVDPRPGRLVLWIGLSIALFGIGMGLVEAGNRGLLTLCLLAAGVGAYLALRPE